MRTRAWTEALTFQAGHPANTLPVPVCSHVCIRSHKQINLYLQKKQTFTVLRDYPSFSSVARAKYPDKKHSVGERNLFSSQFQFMVHQSKDVTVAGVWSNRSHHIHGAENGMLRCSGHITCTEQRNECVDAAGHITSMEQRKECVDVAGRTMYTKQRNKCVDALVTSYPRSRETSA